MTSLDILTSSGKYPDRAKHPEATKEVLDNIERLLIAVCSLFASLPVALPKVSSGFRTTEVNANLANSAKKSLHMKGLAVDLEDKDGSLGKLIKNNPQLLKDNNLWLEDLASTKGWVHLDLGLRSDRPSRVFLP